MYFLIEYCVLQAFGRISESKRASCNPEQGVFPVSASMIIVHACTMITVHACTMIIAHACTMIIVNACTMITGHACTLIIVHACTMIIVHACAMIIHAGYAITRAPDVHLTL